MTLTPPPPTGIESWPLQAAGPAQWDWLIHFCGRSPGAAMSPAVPAVIADLDPAQRLDNMLWEQHLRGFPPFGAWFDQPMICFSESPLDHLKWLLTTREWPPWGLIFNRQYIYDLGGGPAWPVRSGQFASLTRDQQPWAVRLDTTPGSRSDWLFEREWRLPVPVSAPSLALSPANLSAILVGEASWRPSVRDFYTGYYRSGATGEMVHPGDMYAQPEIRSGLPMLWESAAVRVYWDSGTQKFGSIDSAPVTGDQ